MLVRGKRREEGWNVLIAKMVFSHHSGISLMVEQEISNLLVGVRFSHPAQNKLAYCIKFGIIQNGISRNHEEREMANKATTGRGGVLDDPAGWLTTEGKSPVGMAVSQIRVKSVCSKVNPEAETTRELTYPFGSPPKTCPQCGGDVITRPMMVKILCYLEKEEIG